MLRHLLRALVSLQVASAALPAEDPPSIVVFPRDQTVVTGRVAVFVCTAVGNPPPQIEWRRNGKRLVSLRYTVTEITGGSVLRVDSVRSVREDVTYECLAKNGVGDPARAEFKLTVVEEHQIPPGFPHFKKMPDLQSVERNRSALLPCKAEGDPEPKITWLRNEVPVDMSNPRYSLAAAGSLHISDAQEEDQGHYECVAENSVGTAISPIATLFVRAVRWVAPYFTIPPESTYEVSSGAALNLTCVAVGSPMPYVRWRKGGVDLTADGEDVVSRSVLVLENVRETTNYTCVASSSLGVIEQVSQVIVQEDDDQPQGPTYSQVRDAWADFDNHTNQNATTPAGSDSAALSAAVLGLSVPAANNGDHVPAESGITPAAEAAALTGTLSSPQRSLAEGHVSIVLLREEHAIRMRLLQEGHDDILKKRDEEHQLKMEILRLQKEIQEIVLRRLQEGK